MRNKTSLLLLVAIFFSARNIAQHQHHAADTETLPIVSKVESQPLLAQVTRLNEALSFLGSSLSAADIKRIKDLKNNNRENIVKEIQQILDPYCLAMVDINP